MDKQLHIVCFDAPAPPDYGGAIDLYYKIMALAAAGVDITLHYFNYKPERHHGGLEKYCKAIHTYTRKKPWQCLASPLPYIVSSRINPLLIERLNADNCPILLEGVHCTGILKWVTQPHRKVVVRLHNDEAAYYLNLAHAETAPMRNFYYSVESNRLTRYQQLLPQQLTYAALAETDVAVFQQHYGLTQTYFVPCFLPWQKLAVKPGSGSYSLYHGNLSVAENEVAAIWLIKNVFAQANTPFVIAGKSPARKLMDLAAQYQHIRIVADPDGAQMEQLIQDAQVHILPSLNSTGVKLKLLHALYSGRHCVTNKAGVAGSGLEQLVQVAEDAGAMQQSIAQLMQQPFDKKEMQQREALLHLYNNDRNAAALITYLY